MYINKRSLGDPSLLVTKTRAVGSKLSNRYMRVRIDQCFSDDLFVQHGVPQENVIGPTL